MKSFCTLLSLHESQLTSCECDHFTILLERTTSDPKAKIKSRMGKYVLSWNIKQTPIRTSSPLSASPYICRLVLQHTYLLSMSVPSSTCSILCSANTISYKPRRFLDYNHRVFFTEAVNKSPQSSRSHLAPSTLTSTTSPRPTAIPPGPPLNRHRIRPLNLERSRFPVR